MYKEVKGWKEPTPDAEAVEQFSLGQEADPSRRAEDADLSPSPSAVAAPAAALRNPLALLRRRNPG